MIHSLNHPIHSHRDAVEIGIEMVIRCRALLTRLALDAGGDIAEFEERLEDLLEESGRVYDVHKQAFVDRTFDEFTADLDDQVVHLESSYFFQ
jgi:hypothetical protein